MNGNDMNLLDIDLSTIDVPDTSDMTPEARAAFNNMRRVMLEAHAAMIAICDGPRSSTEYHARKVQNATGDAIFAMGYLSH